MIRYRDPLSMAEALEFIEDKKDSDSQAEVGKFIKKFAKLKPENAKKMREKLSALGFLKIKQEYIAKIIDIMPENQENLNKIFIDVGLDEDESKKILETIEEFR